MLARFLQRLAIKFVGPFIFCGKIKIFNLTLHVFQLTFNALINALINESKKANPLRKRAKSLPDKDLRGLDRPQDMGYTGWDSGGTVRRNKGEVCYKQWEIKRWQSELYLMMS